MSCHPPQWRPLPNLLSELPFSALLAYAVRGTLKPARNSQEICKALKRGNLPVIERVAIVVGEHSNVFSDFLGDDVTLVPAPKHAPMRDPDSLSVPRMVAEQLVTAGFGAEVADLLRRDVAVTKSSSAAPENRPKANTHYDSISEHHDLWIAPRRITVIDDVVTRGATMIACASRLAEAFPHADIRGFAVMRTVSAGEIDQPRDPRTGVITLRNGDCFRDP